MEYEKDFQILPPLPLLIETFGDFIHNHKFLPWLSSKLDSYPV